MLCSPALRVAAAKVLRETVAAAREIVLGVVAVAETEAGASKGPLHQVRDRRSTVAMGIYFDSPGLVQNGIVAITSGTDTTSALRR